MKERVHGFGLLAVCALIVITRCAIIPPLQFVEGGIDTSSDSATDSGVAMDGTIGDDGSESADGQGATAETSCTGAQPPFGAICCGIIWCFGECDANCGTCNRCSPLGYCCDTKAGGASCKPISATCRP